MLGVVEVGERADNPAVPFFAVLPFSAQGVRSEQIEERNENNWEKMQQLPGAGAA